MGSFSSYLVRWLTVAVACLSVQSVCRGDSAVGVATTKGTFVSAKSGLSFGPVGLANDFAGDPTLTVKAVELEYYFSDDTGYLGQKAVKKINLSLKVGQTLTVLLADKNTCVYQARVRLLVYAQNRGDFYVVGSYPLESLNSCWEDLLFHTKLMINKVW
jgi:hypothetical protein